MQHHWKMFSVLTWISQIPQQFSELVDFAPLVITETKFLTVLQWSLKKTVNLQRGEIHCSVSYGKLNISTNYFSDFHTLQTLQCSVYFLLKINTILLFADCPFNIFYFKICLFSTSSLSYADMTNRHKNTTMTPILCEWVLTQPLPRGSAIFACFKIRLMLCCVAI